MSGVQRRDRSPDDRPPKWQDRHIIFRVYAMMFGRSEDGGVVIRVIGWLSAGLAALVVGIFIGTVTTIGDLLTKSRYLRQAITNLTKEDQIGYAKVLTQWKDDQKGRLITRLLFVETDRNDKSRQVLRKEYEIDGDVVHFDAMVVKFGNRVVTDGTERALYRVQREFVSVWNHAASAICISVESFLGACV